MKSTVLKFGMAAGLLLAAIKFSEYSFLTFRIGTEVYVAIISVLFLAAGIFVGIRMRRKEVVEIPVEVPVQVSEFSGPDENVISDLNITKREMDVLRGISQGLSNQEIADQLFVSLSTIKTHTNRLYVKLDVKRRTQAVTKAKELRLID